MKAGIAPAGQRPVCNLQKMWSLEKSVPRMKVSGKGEPRKEGGDSCTCERRLKKTSESFPSRSTGYKSEAGGGRERGGIFG